MRFYFFLLLFHIAALFQVKAQVSLPELEKNALRKLDRKEYAAALVDFDLIIKTQPRNAEMLIHRGECKNELQDYAGAIADFNQALVFEPQSAAAFAYRGSAKNMLDQRAEAILDFNTALDLDPNNATLISNRGTARFALHDTLGALRDFDAALRLDAHNSLARFNRASVRLNSHQLEGALSDFNQYIQDNPKQANGYLMRSVLLYWMEDFNRSAKDAAVVAKLTPQDTDAIMWQGFVFEKLNNMPAAQRCYTTALANSADKSAFYLERGNWKSEDKNLRGGCQDWQQAALLGNAEAQQLLLTKCQ